MTHDEKPENFKPDLEVVGCLVECGGKIILIHRQNNKLEGNKWGIPAGKIDKTDLNIKEAMARELREETGIIAKEEDLIFYKTFCVSHLGYNFYYHYFNLKLTKVPDIVLSKDEHKAFVWVTPNEALNMDLIIDEDHCMKNFYKIN